MADYIPDSKQGRVSMTQPICCVVNGVAEGAILIGVEMRGRQQSERLLTLLKRGPIVLVEVVVATKVRRRNSGIQETDKRQYGENTQPLFHTEICRKLLTGKTSSKTAETI